MTYSDLLVKCIQKCTSTAYEEPTSPKHAEICKAAIRWVVGNIQDLDKKCYVADIGCGDCCALDELRNLGLDNNRSVAVSSIMSEYSTAIRKGYGACKEDMHLFFSNQPSIYDPPHNFLIGHCGLIIMRHSLEHSPFPYYMISGAYDYLSPGGYLYVEMPSPDTDCLHEFNRNHWSVMNSKMLESLCVRAGLEVVAGIEIRLSTEAGPDLYYGRLMKKPLTTVSSQGTMKE